MMFHVVTAGQCWLEVEGASSCHLRPGDLALVPHGEGGETVITRLADILVIQATRSWIARDTGPHPITRNELRAASNPGVGWTVASIEPNRIQTRFHDHGAPAWLATIKRS
jgi:hypothetical protein